MTITGPRGSIRWGYRPVASLGSWSFTGTRADGTVTAQLTDSDEMGLEQSPLVVVVPAGQAQWRWPVRELKRDGLAVTITVGPME